MSHRWVPAWLLVVTGCAAPAVPAQTVRPGIDVLLADSSHLVQGRRVGLLTNQTGVDWRGEGDVERLLRAGVRLTALFSPEHGFRGASNQNNIGNAVDSATGLPIYSLYGTVRAPTPEMLRNVDVLLVDLQDIGARTYTYISTTLLTIRAAAEANRAVVVLDRPNPLGGVAVQGPVLDTAVASFVGMLPVPLRHGMTLAELVRFGTAALGIAADVRVVPVTGWVRDAWFDQTGLPWVRPSPNMPNLESATHYPGLVVFEGTNLSVGRGTPIAFQVVASPWLDPARVRTAIGVVPGVSIRDTTIVPRSPADRKYDGEHLPALRFHVTDRAAYDPTRLAARLLAAVRQVHDRRLTLNPATFDRLAGGQGWRRAVESGRSGDDIWREWQGAIAEFARIREAYLLYR